MVLRAREVGRKGVGRWMREDEVNKEYRIGRLNTCCLGPY